MSGGAQSAIELSVPSTAYRTEAKLLYYTLETAVSGQTKCKFFYERGKAKHTVEHVHSRLTEFRVEGIAFTCTHTHARTHTHTHTHARTHTHSYLKGEFPEAVEEAGEEDLLGPGPLQTIPQHTKQLQLEQIVHCMVSRFHCRFISRTYYIYYGRCAT